MTSSSSSMPRPTLHELQSCQFSSWYPTFRNLHHNNEIDDDSAITTPKYKHKNVTIKSIIIKPLPHDFVPYLLSDGVTLPVGATAVSSFVPNNEDGDDDWSSSSSSCNNQHGDNDNQDDHQDSPPKQYHFPNLNQQIQQAIETLGGSALPKFNWSSPKDAAWMHDSHTMKCTTVGDVYLLLKCSDFIVHDIVHALDDVVLVNDDDDDDETRNGVCASDGHNGGDYNDNHNNDDNECGDRKSDPLSPSPVEYELVLRKWSHLHASMEFRCFVANHHLVAISQRNHTQYYPHLKRDHMILKSHILDFFHHAIQGRYASGTVPNYVLDVYVDKNDRVWLIDFNLWATRTDSLLFSWNELMIMMEEQHLSTTALAIASMTVDNDGGCVGANQETNDTFSDGTERTEIGESDGGRADKHKEELVLDVEENNNNYNTEMRIVETENEVQYDPLSSYRAPIDTVDLASDQAGSTSFQEFMKMCEKPSKI